MTLDQFRLLEISLRVAAALGVFLLGRRLAHRSREALGNALAETTITPSMARLMVLAAYYGILLGSLILSLTLLGFPLQTLLAATLVIVIVLGIALQQSIANLAATIIFMLFQPFRIGELVDANGMLGTVKELQLFSTVLVTGDNKEVTIPNAQIQNNNLINYTRLGWLRNDFVFSVSRDADLDRVKAIVSEILAADERVLAEPPPDIFVLSLDDSWVNLAVRPYVKPDDYWTLQWDLYERVKRCLDAAGISIPFPQSDVHVDVRGAADLLK
jgi:small conductance mechanosensitive channel